MQKIPHINVTYPKHSVNKTNTPRNIKKNRVIILMMVIASSNLYSPESKFVIEKAHPSESKAYKKPKLL